MKVCVYAICKNEVQFVDRWVDSMSEADEIFVLDTGSTDDSAERLEARGVKVAREIITPWRFDVARNRSMELLPADTDICVCTDLDEVFRPGWREALERAWISGAEQCRYHYVWSVNPDGSEGLTFWPEKVHSRRGWQWIHPVHEVLERIGKAQPACVVWADDVWLEHYPDPQKSRSQYLELLELSVKEDPDDDRNMHYLGREYLFRGRWDDCIETLKRHLEMPRATWADERAASMRYIAKAWAEKGEAEEAWNWYLKAIAEAPHLREPYVDLAMLLYQQEQWDGVLYFTGRALEIAARPQTYISEAAAWGSLPYDIRSIALHQTGRITEALTAAKQALALEASNERLHGNVAILEAMLKKGE